MILCAFFPTLKSLSVFLFTISTKFYDYDDGDDELWMAMLCAWRTEKKNPIKKVYRFTFTCESAMEKDKYTEIG